MAKARGRKKGRTLATVVSEQEDRALLQALRRHDRLLREISKQTKRVERLREKAKSDLLDFGIRIANQAGWKVSASTPAAEAEQTV